MSQSSQGPGGRSRRLAALSLDDETKASNVVEKRADKTVPLAVYGGSTGQGATPLPPSAQPVSSGGNVGTTTAPLPAQSAPPVVSTPALGSAVAAAPTPTLPVAASATSERAAVSTRTGVDKGHDEIEGPPMAKTPWVAIGVVGVIVVIIGVIAAVVLGGGSKTDGAGGATPAKSGPLIPLDPRRSYRQRCHARSPAVEQRATRRRARLLRLEPRQIMRARPDTSRIGGVGRPRVNSKIVHAEDAEVALQRGIRCTRARGIRALGESPASSRARRVRSTLRLAIALFGARRDGQSDENQAEQALLGKRSVRALREKSTPGIGCP